MTAVIILFYLITLGAGFFLRTLNLRHLKRYGSTVPSGFEGAVEPETLRKTVAYTLDQSRLGLAESLFDAALLLIFLFGLLPAYDRWLASLGGSFVLSGVLFFLGLTLIQTFLGIPFDLYGTFRLEVRYGFNTTTPGLWLSDLAKSTLIAVVLTGLLVAGAFALVAWSPRFWWLWVWGFFAMVSLFLMYLSPYVIEPLFNRFEPVAEEGLEEEIRALCERAGLRVSRVMQVDASRRSRHSNAYFTGIGRVKRIVLYDTLIRQMSHREILAVLAHEIGHWKKGHIRRRLILTEAGALAGSWFAWKLTGWEGFPGLIGLTDASFAARLVILGFLGSIVSSPFTPLSSWLSRRHEREADRFATDITGDAEALASALVKLSTENLSNLHPHPLYAAFYYSHPPVVERVGRLRAAMPPAGKAGETTM
ncbi:Ste24 endopeptidase [Geobacter metallireducens RCH3]|uniref:M48 family metallopeptidase n=1 Tax=Geobacter metallireducens TaxID=28232 RepID=UPI00024A5252|nr:M48 family metallopeptidase [Geobacter metallireducens]EHP85023.1 Ste24 endopeptidase [Geobacter metallireducens RCH3]